MLQFKKLHKTLEKYTIHLIFCLRKIHSTRSLKTSSQTGCLKKLYFVLFPKIVYVLWSGEYIKALHNNKWGGEILILSVIFLQRSSERCLMLYCFISLPSFFQLTSLKLTKTDVLVGSVRSTTISLLFP